MSESSIKILVVSTNWKPIPLNGYGGLEMIAYWQAKELAALGHEVALMCPEGSTMPPGVTHIPTKQGESDAESLKAHKDVMIDFGANGVIIDNTWSKWSYMLKKANIEAGKVQRFGVIGVCHTTIATDLQSPPPVTHPCLVGISKDHARSIEEHLGVTALPIYNGVDMDFYKNLSQKKREDRWAFVNRLSKIKGPHIAVRVAKETGIGLDIGGDVSLTGEPEYAHRVISQCDPEQIRWWGELSRPKTVEWYSTKKALLNSICWCLKPDQLITTKHGVVPISEIKKDDAVLTHEGKFRSVRNKWSKAVDNEIVRIFVAGTNIPLELTREHRIRAMKLTYCSWNKMLCNPDLNCCSDVDDAFAERRVKYEKVLELVGAAATIRQASIVAGVPETTAYYWAKGKTEPPKPRGMPFHKYYGADWLAAESVDVGDYVEVPFYLPNDRAPKTLSLTKFCEKHRHPNTKPVNETVNIDGNLARLAGYYIAEGCTDGGRIEFCFGPDEQDLMNEAVTLVESIFGRSGTTRLRPSTANGYICSVVLRDAFLEWFGHKAPNKTIPNWLWLQPNEITRDLVRGLWAGDGNASHCNKYGIFEYMTTSVDLAWKLRDVLLRFGVFSTLYKKRQGAKAKGAGNVIYHLRVTGRNAQKFSEEFGFEWTDNRSDKAWKGHHFWKDGRLYVRVRKKSYENYKGNVFDIEVSGDHSYVASGVSVHNSEPFGMVPVEAQACGMPVVTFARGSMPEIVWHGVTGFVCKDESEMTAFIKGGAVDELDADDCRGWAEWRFNAKRMGRNYAKLCARVMDGREW